MSTFSNTSPSQPTAQGHAFATAPSDDVLVYNLRTGDAQSMLPRLNADLGMQLSESAYQRIQSFFRNTLHRDPTVGELRLLDGLDRHGKDSPARIAVGEIITESPVLAETWADMMQKHGALHGVGHTFRGKGPAAAPPCTLTDALGLTGRYLHSLDPHRATSRVLLSTPAQEAVASAEGYTPVARILAGKETLSLWTRKEAVFPVAPPRKGDFILYLPRAELSKIQTLLAEESQKNHPALHDIRAVAEKSMLLTLAELCPGMDLYVNRLMEDTPSDGTLPVDTLCSYPTVQSDGVCDFLLRVPVKQVQTATEVMKRLGISSVVCGQAKNDGNTVIHLRDARNTQDIPVTKLPTAFLATMGAVYLHSFKPQHGTSVAPHPAITPITRLPSALLGESGLTPENREAVALTLHEGRILSIPDVLHLTATASSILRRADMAFAQAAETVVAVTDQLRSADVTPENMILSVSLTVSSTEVLKGGAVLSAIMGIYRVAAERGLSVEDPAITVAPTEGLLRVTVTAHAEDENEFSERLDCPPNRQWSASGMLPHKESPGFLFPVIRHSYEGCLKALSAALNRDDAARCIIRPVLMDKHEIEITNGSDAPDKEIRYTLNSDSVKEFCEQMHNWLTPIFCMNEEDTRTLLANPTVLDSLNHLMDIGYPIIVLGESCKVFAEYGFLPADLMHMQSLPITRRKATVTYAIPAEPSARLLRGRLLSAPVPHDLRHLLTLRFPDGTAIPDGFAGRNGKVLGILNGVDTTILPVLRKHTFDF